MKGIIDPVASRRETQRLYQIRYRKEKRFKNRLCKCNQKRSKNGLKRFSHIEFFIYCERVKYYFGTDSLGRLNNAGCESIWTISNRQQIKERIESEIFEIIKAIHPQRYHEFILKD